MTRKLSSAPCAAGLLLFALLFGCSKNEEPAPPPQQAPAAKPAAQPAPPVQKPLSSAARAGSQLDFRHRTDPFKPFAPVVEAPAARPGQPSRSTADLLPIQTFEVNKFTVVGIIAGLQENRALLIDPNGKGYVVKEGMQIGSNDGRITRITASSVEVVERFREDSGRFKTRKVVLTLAKKR